MAKMSLQELKYNTQDIWLTQHKAGKEEQRDQKRYRKKKRQNGRWKPNHMMGWCFLPAVAISELLHYPLFVFPALNLLL